MFDKRLRPSVEERLQPVGANLKRSGITADHLTLAGMVMAVGAAVAIANGALRLGFVLLLLTAVPDVLDGAVAKASGTATPRGAFFDSVADRVTDALLLGGIAWYLESTPSAVTSPCCRWPCSPCRCSSRTSGRRRNRSGSTRAAASWSGPSG